HATDDARDLATHDHTLRGDRARHLALLADDDLGAGHIALDLAIDLQGALADDLQALADDLEVVADDRLVAGVAAARHCHRRAHGRGLARRGAGLHGLERLGLRLGAAREHENAPGGLYWASVGRQDHNHWVVV